MRGRGVGIAVAGHKRTRESEAIVAPLNGDTALTCAQRNGFRINHDSNKSENA